MEVSIGPEAHETFRGALALLTRRKLLHQNRGPIERIENK
jgi:hypothetical protein